MFVVFLIFKPYYYFLSFLRGGISTILLDCIVGTLVEFGSETLQKLLYDSRFT